MNKQISHRYQVIQSPRVIKIKKIVIMIFHIQQQNMMFWHNFHDIYISVGYPKLNITNKGETQNNRSVHQQCNSCTFMKLSNFMKSYILYSDFFSCAYLRKFSVPYFLRKMFCIYNTV